MNWPSNREGRRRALVPGAVAWGEIVDAMGLLLLR
jgi:hypothetical protein